MLVSCNQKEEIKKVTPESNKTIVAKKVSKIEIQSFYDLPTEIDGAGCYFSVSKKDFEKERYIFVSNYDSICFIKKYGHFIKLRLFENKTDNPSVEHYIEKYKNDEFELTVDFKDAKVKTNNELEDEPSIFEGTLSVKQAKYPVEKIDLYGYCGC